MRSFEFETNVMGKMWNLTDDKIQTFHKIFGTNYETACEFEFWLSNERINTIYTFH